MTLQLEGIEKSFQGVRALKGVSIQLRPGQIHALLGENGAGKSTLIRIICGVQQPDEGRLLLDGTPTRFDGPNSAVQAGISVVHQERHIVEKFSVAENMFLHDVPRRHGLVDYRMMYAQAHVWLRRLGLDVDARQEMGKLGPGLSQLVAIAKALSLECRYLLLDEPTASIGESEVELLFGILRRLRDNGTSILFVSHKLHEVEALCDHVTVIRDGANVLDAVPPSRTTRAALVEAMVGRNVFYVPFPERTVSRDAKAPALELRKLSTEYGHADINLSVAAGEIVGLYGLVGAGRTEMARCLVGLAKITGGEMRIDGRVASVSGPHDALRRFGLGYVSEDRKSEGLILQLPIRRNVGITIWDKISSFLGWITDARAEIPVRAAVERLNVKASSFALPVSALSGGNQQKVSVSKWLAVGASVLVFDEPTVGIDIGSKDEMHRLIWDLARAGKAILLISSDLAEITHLSDRILVMSSFRISAEISNIGTYDELSKKIMSVVTLAA